MITPILGVLPILGLVILIDLGLLLYIILSKSPKVDKVMHDLTDDLDEKSPETLIQEEKEALQNIQDRVEKDKSEIKEKTKDIEKLEEAQGGEKGKESASGEKVGE